MGQDFLHTESNDEPRDWIYQVHKYYHEFVVEQILLLVGCNIIFNAILLYVRDQLKHFLINFIMSFIGFLIAMYIIIFVITIIKNYKRWKHGSREC